MSKIDIIILTHNHIDSTKKCVEYLYRYTHDFRLIIFDNASTDNTSLFLKKLSKEKDNVDFYLSSENRGIICGRNDAYEFLKNLYSVSDYIMFLDNDQFVRNGWLESYYKYLREYDIVGSEAWKMKSDFYPYKRLLLNEPFSYVGCGGMVIKKEVIDKIGLFDTMFSPKYYEDPDFIFRAYREGFKIGWNQDKKIVHNHKGPLLNKESRLYFMDNWKKFQEKWNGFKLPVFKMEKL